MFKTIETEYKNTQPTDDWLFSSGPRQKNAATAHLEYIVSAYLNEDPYTLSFGKNKEIITKINGYEFNLTQILKFVDFEHFSFPNVILNQFEKWYNTLPNAIKTSHKINLEKVYPHLHRAEKIAINWWTQNVSFTEIQNLLRGKTSDLQQVPYTLLFICIASHGLSRFYLSKSTCPQYSAVRLEKDTALFSLHSERKDKETKKTLVVNSGFTAAAKDGHGSSDFEQSQYFFDSKIYFLEPEGLSSIGHDISQLSNLPEEHEILFPPSTEFKYQHLGEADDYDIWKAYPMRSLYKEQHYAYKHNIDDFRIGYDKIMMHLKSLYNFLKDEKEKNTHSRFRSFFDTVDNTQKIKCLSDIIEELKKINEHYRKNPNIEDLYEDSLKLMSKIKKNINLNKRFVDEAKTKTTLGVSHPASLGNTHQCLTDSLSSMQKISTEIQILSPVIYRAQVPNPA